jgi:hypothetical protein
MKAFESQNVRRVFAERLDSLNAQAAEHLSKGECFGYDFVITASLPVSNETTNAGAHEEL